MRPLVALIVLAVAEVSCGGASPRAQEASPAAALATAAVRELASPTPTPAPPSPTLTAPAATPSPTLAPSQTVSPTAAPPPAPTAALPQAAIPTAAPIATRAPTPTPAPCRGVPFDPAKTGLDGYLTWNQQPVAGVEVYVTTGEYEIGPKIASAVTDANGYWKLVGFTDIERKYGMFHEGRDVYGSSGFSFNEFDWDLNRLCANKVVHLNSGSAVVERSDSLPLRKYIDGIVLRPSAAGSTAITWDPRHYVMGPVSSVPAGDLAVSWQPLAGSQQYCVKLFDATGGGWVEGPQTCLSGTAYTFRALASGQTYALNVVAWGISRKQHDMIGNELVYTFKVN